MVKHQLGLSTGDLSIALVGAPTGLLIAMRAIPPVIARRSSAFVLRCAILLGALSLGCLGLMGGLASLAVCLVFFGIATGALDIMMNVQGTAWCTHVPFWAKPPTLLSRPIATTARAALRPGCSSSLGSWLRG